MGNAKTCCFIGHSEIYEDISRLLTSAVEQHISEHGVTEFLVGNYGDFDRMAARTVKAAKGRHPGIRLYLMLPYVPEMGRPLPDTEGFDGTVYPEGMETAPYKLAIPRLNRLMVQQSDYAIAYVRYAWGGAAKTLHHAEVKARKGQLQITNLALQSEEEKCVSR